MRVTCALVASVMVVIGIGNLVVAYKQLSWSSAVGVVFDDLRGDQAMVRFTDERERTWEVKARWEGPEDEVVVVRYDPDDPSDVSLDDRWTDFAQYVLVGLLFLAGGLALISPVLRSRRRFRPQVLDVPRRPCRAEYGHPY